MNRVATAAAATANRVAVTVMTPNPEAAVAAAMNRVAAAAAATAIRVAVTVMTNHQMERQKVVALVVAVRRVIPQTLVFGRQ
ncbi:Protein of unknown function [Gryllus bimaculatus]|nr:Protein of unknown function [Gryllus bimaculatus]